MKIKHLIKKALGLLPRQYNVGTSNESTRIHWLEDTLKKIPIGYRILDAGAGEQQFKKFCSHLNYVSQDFAGYNPENIKQGLQMESWDYGNLDIISDIATIPEKNESFDVIMCTEVFEHIINPREALREFFRLLKPGGSLIITAPFCSLTHFAPYHFYTGFSEYFYKKELEEIGFNIIEIEKNGNYFEYLAQELRRLPSIASKYTNIEMTEKEIRLISGVISALNAKSMNDMGSSELLCFGIHVLAKKYG